MEKKGLGKGLGALIPGADKEANAALAAGAASGGGVAEVEVAKITANPYQPRGVFNDEKFQDLVSSVRVHGVLQPVVVRSRGDGGYELVAGERRLRAARAAGLARIPAVVREMTNEQSLQVALVENLQREDINAIDAAIAYKRLADEFGFSQEDLAFGMGKSRSAIANTMRLLSLPDAVKADLSAGKISEGHARAILSVEGEGAQLDLCARIIAGGLSVREAEKLAKGEIVTKGRETAHDVSRETIAPAVDPNLLEVESELRRLYGTKVSISKNKDRGRIVMEFYSDDDLDRLIQLLNRR